MERYLAERETEVRVPKHEKWLSIPAITFLGGKRLNQISLDDVKAYQGRRLKQANQRTKKETENQQTIHPETVNKEVKLLLRLLKRARLRHLLYDVKMLKLQRVPKEMLTPEQKLKLFETASTKPQWQTAYCAALLTANASLRPCEIKRLIWADVDTTGEMPTLIVRRSKTEAGSRVIPLNQEALASLTALQKRAQALGTARLDNYVFPRMWPKVDGTKPMASWRTAWRNLREAAGMPGLRYYDLRHLFVTELIEIGVPEGVIRELAGHVDPAMTRWYSHARMASRKAAVEKLSIFSAKAEKSDSQEGYVTTYVTKLLAEATSERQPTESNGRAAGI